MATSTRQIHIPKPTKAKRRLPVSAHYQERLRRALALRDRLSLRLNSSDGPLDAAALINEIRDERDEDTTGLSLR
jgi:hypothetical protein